MNLITKQKLKKKKKNKRKDPFFSVIMRISPWMNFKMNNKVMMMKKTKTLLYNQLWISSKLKNVPKGKTTSIGTFEELYSI